MESEHGEKPSPTEDGTIALPRQAALHLRAALERTESLLQTQALDVALEHLVALLQHLRAVGRFVA